MGTIQHHAIIVTGVDYQESTPVADLYAIAKEIFPVVSEILFTRMNGYSSFFIPPDGSKEGWEESDLGDERRELFLLQAEESCCETVTISYGELGYEVMTIRTEDPWL